MKFKPKHAIAALAIAVAGPASAQVINFLPDTGNSSFYFVALDETPNAARSYFTQMVANAGSSTTGVLRFEDLMSNPTGTWTITLSGLNGFVGSASLDNIFGGFGAADTSATVGGGTSQATGNRRLLNSIAAGGPAPVFSNSQVGAAASGGVNFQNFVGQVSGECPSSPCIAANSGQLAYAGIQNGSAGIGTQWGFSAGPSIADVFSGEIGWDIYLAATSGANSLPANVTQLALHAVLDLATNLLTISGATTPDVPVPAAVWLLGSAMLGFVGIGRRKKGQSGQLADGAVAA